MKKIAVIAGAGPAGLTAALELLRRSNVTPIVFEADSQVGGISKTVLYRGNRIDLGGHRFFSKSDWVMRWWQDILPVDPSRPDPGVPLNIHYQCQTHTTVPTRREPQSSDAILLVRQRLSRIFYRRTLFDYPLKLNANTLRNLGVTESLRIGLSYAGSRLKPRTDEKTLEDFFINRFGRRLYGTFFKDYTEKVWGVQCREISAEWGMQRIKGLSVSSAIRHALTHFFRPTDHTDTAQRGTETSLIERFLYPKLGPGQMWEEVTRRIERLGGTVHLRHRVVGIERDGDTVAAITVHDEASDSTRRVRCDHFVSTIPIAELIRQLQPADRNVAHVASNLPYRDFMTIGLLVRRMNTLKRQHVASAPNGMPPDNWIYIQEPDVRIGRLQIFNNWSPAMVADPDTIWLGLEYFCREGDDLWSMADGRMIDFAARELEHLGLIDRRDVIDATLIRVPKAYPAYFGAYDQFDTIRRYLNQLTNLYPIGRNGMHRYNNQDHSMLAANVAVDAILDEGRDKATIWDVNADSEYHEEETKLSEVPPGSRVIGGAVP